MKNEINQTHVPPRSVALLTDFTTFCFDNPDLRFWQALAHWMNAWKIVALTHLPNDPNERIRAARHQEHDTYYWEERNPYDRKS